MCFITQDNKIRGDGLTSRSTASRPEIFEVFAPRHPCSRPVSDHLHPCLLWLHRYFSTGRTLPFSGDFYRSAQFRLLRAPRRRPLRHAHVGGLALPSPASKGFPARPKPSLSGVIESPATGSTIFRWGCPKIAGPAEGDSIAPEGEGLGNAGKLSSPGMAHERSPTWA